MLLYGLRKGIHCIYRKPFATSYTHYRSFETGFITQNIFQKYIRLLLPAMAEKSPSVENNTLSVTDDKKPKSNIPRNEIHEATPNNSEDVDGNTNKTPKKKRHRNRSGKKKQSEVTSESIPDCLLSANPTKAGPERNGPDNQLNKSNRKSNQSRNKLPDMHFEKYMSLEDCSEGLKLGELIKGSLRINPRSFSDAYISSAGERDIYLEGVVSRNRALPGDIVAVKLLPMDNSTPGATSIEGKDPIKKGKVVYIIEKKHPRVACGFLRPYRGNSFGFALMSPVDNRLPRLMIPLNECPEDFKTKAVQFEKTLFLATIQSWSINMAFAGGRIMRSLGEAGHIEPETEAILTSNDIDSTPFSQEVIHCLPNGNNWRVSEQELKKRKDLRNECIFTIDPATARDLDDALSCKKIDDDIYEVGVHIADVSHFVEQGNALDHEAKKRATSVYLAQRVIPMLPSVLCEKLCSLNPGVERLAYSVIWNLRSDGTVLSEWFGRTVIRSCAKLSYDHAQQLIDCTDDSVLQTEEFPKIFGDYPLTKISSTVKLLYGISKHLRKRRFDSGALRLDQPKLAFSMDDKTGMPNGCYVYQYKDSNRMIEEFMLLANMAVGHRIYKSNPKKAILRNHPPPQEVMMKDVEDVCRKFNIPFDISDSASISKSLTDIAQLDGEKQRLLLPALTLLCTKPFQNAKYFCTGSIDDEAAYRHYALNVPIYTHFTSPIRRYPDMLVHRFLTSALDKSYTVRGDIEDLQITSEHCNDKKWAAKKASEQSGNLFFAVYLLEAGPLTEKGVIVAVLDKAIDVLCTRVGIVTRVYLDKHPLWKYDFSLDVLKPTITLVWKEEENIDKIKGDLDQQLKTLTERFEKKWEVQKQVNADNVNVKVPDNAITQTLTIFSPVDVVLSVNVDLPTKILAHLTNPTSDKLPELQL